MIICSCNVISDGEIKRALDELKEEFPQLTITPDLIFKSLGRQPKCGSCITGITKIMREQDTWIL